MSGTPIQVVIQFMADARNAVANGAKVEKMLEGIRKAAEQTGFEVTKTATSNKKLSDSNDKLATSSQKVSRAQQQQLATSRQLAQQQSFLANAWKDGSHIVDRRYLNSIKGLRQGLARFNSEAKSTIVWHKGLITTLDDQALAYNRLMLKGNLITRTFDNIGRSAVNLGKNAQWTGRQMMVGITAPLAAIGVMSVKTARDIAMIELELTKITGLVAGDSFWGNLDQQSRDLSKTFGVARTELKELQVQFARTGFDLPDVERATRMSVELSMVGSVPLEDAAALVEVLRKVGLSWEELEDQLQKFNIMDDRTNLSLRETASSLKEVYPTARQFNISAAETAALMAGITQQGFSASEAAHSLNYALVKLPTALANLDAGVSGGRARLKDLQDQLTNISQRSGIALSLYDDNEQIKEGVELLKTIGLAYDILRRSGQRENSNAMIAFRRAAFGTENAPEGTALLEALGDAMSGATAQGRDLALALEVAQGNIGSFAAEWTRQLGAVENSDAVKIAGQIQGIVNSAQEIGRKLLPIVVNIMEKLVELIEKFENLPEGVQRTLIAMATGLAALGPIVYTVGQLMIAGGTLFRGMIAPVKSMFGLNRRLLETFEGSEDIADELMGISDALRRGGSRPELLERVKELTDEVLNGATASGAMTTALDTQTASIKAQTTALSAHASAQMKSNAAVSSGALQQANFANREKERGVISSFKYGLSGQRRQDELKRLALEGANAALPTLSVPEVDPSDLDLNLMPGLREEIRQNLIDIQTASLMAKDNVVTRRVTPKGNVRQVNELNAAIAEIDNRLEEIGAKSGDFRTAARTLADAEISNAINLDAASVRRQRDMLLLAKSQVETFEEVFGYPLPIMPNMDIADAGERMRDYAMRTNFFIESIDSQLGSPSAKNLDELAKMLRTDLNDPVELHAIFSDAIRDAKAGMALSGVDAGDLDDAARVVVEQLQNAGTKDFSEYLQAMVAAGRKPILPVRSGSGNEPMNLAIKDLATLSRAMSEKTGRPQILTDTTLNNIRTNIMAGPDIINEIEFAQRFWEEAEAAFKADNTEAYLATLDAGMASGIRDFVNATRASVGASEGLGRKRSSATKAVEGIWQQFNKQDEQAEKIIGYLKDFADGGDEMAITAISRLQSRKDEAGAALARIQNAIGAGLMPAQEDFENFKSSFLDVENIKQEIRNAESFGLSRKRSAFAPLSIDQFDLPVSQTNIGFSRDRYMARYQELLEQERERLFNERLREVEGDLERVGRIRVPKRTQEALSLQASREAVQGRSSSAVRSMPSEKSALAQRRTTEFNNALRRAGINRKANEEAGRAHLDEIFATIGIGEDFDPSKVSIPSYIDDQMLGLSGKVTAADRYAAEKAFVENILNKARDEYGSPEQRMNTMLEDWLSRAKSSGDVGRFAEREGLPEPLKQSLAAALYGGATEKEYTDILRSAIGKDSPLETDSMMAINALAAQISKRDGFYQEANQFAARASALIERRTDEIDFSNMRSYLTRPDSGSREDFIDEVFAEAHSVWKERDNEVMAFLDNAKNLRDETIASANEIARRSAADKTQEWWMEELEKKYNESVSSWDDYYQFMEYLDSDEMQRDRRNTRKRFDRRIKRYQEQEAQRIIKEAEDRFKDQLREAEAMKAHRDEIQGLLSRLEVSQDKIGGFGDNDLDVMRKVWDQTRDPVTGRFASGGSPDVAYLVGGLSPEMSKAIYEMTVKQTEGTIEGINGAIADNLGAASAIIRKHHPNISDELVDEYARYGLLTSRRLAENMDEARIILGDNIARELADLERSRSMLEMGMAGQLNTFDNLGAIDAPRAREAKSTFDFEYAKNGEVNFGSALMARSSIDPQTAIDDLMSGFAKAEISEAEARVGRTSQRLREIERQIRALEDEELEIVKRHGRRRGAAVTNNIRALKEEAENLRRDQADTASRIESLTRQVFDVDSETGKTTTFKSYDDYVNNRRKAAASLVRDSDIASISDSERKAILDAIQIDLDNKTAVENALRAAQREQASVFAVEDLARSRRSWRGSGRMSDDDLGILGQLHAEDLAAGRARQRYGVDDVARRRQYEALLAANAAAGVTGRVGPAGIDAQAGTRAARMATHEGMGTIDGMPVYGPAIPEEMMLPVTRQERRQARTRARVARGATRRGIVASTVGSFVNRAASASGGAIRAAASPRGLMNAAAWMTLVRPIQIVTGGIQKLGTTFASLFASFAARSSVLTALFPNMAGAMPAVIAAAGPISLILAAIAAAVAAIALNFNKWIDFARPGLEKLKEAGSALISAVMTPLRGLFAALGSEAEGAADGVGSLWENVGKIIGFVADIVSKAITFIIPFVKTFMESVSTGIYVVVQLFRAFFALITGDMGDFKDAVSNIWRELWNVMRLLGASGINLVIQMISQGLQLIVSSVGSVVSSLVGWIPGVGGALRGFVDDVRDGVNEAIKGIENTMTSGVMDLIGPDDTWHQRGRSAGSAAGTGINDAAREATASGGPLALPEIDDAAIAEAQDKLKKFLSAFQNQMRRVVDGWKKAAMQAFDDWAKAQVDALDKKIEAIDEEIKVERERDQDLDYLRRKEELRNRRRSEQIRHTAARDLAVYEGRYDDAKQLEYDYSQTLEQLARDERDLEEDRQKTLTGRVRDAAKERIAIEKDELQESLNIRREQMQKQLDAMTEYIPKNVAEAQRMHSEIQATMQSFTDGYGVIGRMQAEEWGANWSTAFGAAQKQVAEEAYWAGEEVMKQFATALGIDPELVSAPAGSGGDGGFSDVQRAINHGSGPLGGMSSGGRELPERDGTPLRRHSGGPIGNTSMAPSDVPATLQTGEYVIRRSAVSKLGTDFLDQINQGHVCGANCGAHGYYHEGGLVGIAANAMRRTFRKHVGNWMEGKGSLRLAGEGGQTADQYKNALQGAYQARFGGPSGGGQWMSVGDTSGMSVAHIVDNIVKGIHPDFQKRLAAWNAEMGNKFQTHRGYRSMAQQAYLYDRWMRRVPGQAQAAPPGRSMHNFGLAVDLIPASTTAAQRAAGAKYGLRWPMSFEPWHVEPVEARQWRDQIMRGVVPGGATHANPTGDTGGIKLRDDLFGTSFSNLSNPAVGGTEGVKGLVRSMMLQHGWGDGEWPALERLVHKESSWNPSAANPKSSARGLFQFLKATWDNYIARRGGPAYWSHDPAIQAQGGLQYIRDRYGSPSRALDFHNKNNWYHNGGLVFPEMAVGGSILGDGIAKVHAGETVLTAGLTDLLRDALSQGRSGDLNFTVEINGFMGSDRELEKLVDTIETRVVPKIQRARGNENRLRVGSVTD